MRYLGGKSKHGKQLVQAIREDEGLRSIVIEPFCGGLGMSEHLAKAPEVGQISCSDFHPAVISLYQAMLEGWEPPTEVSEVDRTDALELPDSDPFKAFARIGCGYVGNWTSGYAEGGGRNYASETARCLTRQIGTLALLVWILLRLRAIS